MPSSSLYKRAHDLCQVETLGDERDCPTLLALRAQREAGRQEWLPLAKQLFDFVESVYTATAPRNIEEGELLWNVCDYYGMDDLKGDIATALKEAPDAQD